MQHDEKLGTRLIHHVVPQGGLAMQHDEKLGTMKLIMLYRQGGPYGYNILILILVRWLVNLSVGPSVPISLQKLVTLQLLCAWGLVTTFFYFIEPLMLKTMFSLYDTILL
jgi:hypothetical protein